MREKEHQTQFRDQSDRKRRSANTAANIKTAHPLVTLGTIGGRESSSALDHYRSVGTEDTQMQVDWRLRERTGVMKRARGTENGCDWRGPAGPRRQSSPPSAAVPGGQS